MGKFKKEGFKWVSEFLMAMSVGFLFFAITIATAATITGSAMTLMVASFVVFVILTVASFGFRMVTV